MRGAGKKDMKKYEKKRKREIGGVECGHLILSNQTHKHTQ